MDKIISARIDDRIFKQINNLAQKMHATKKAVIEKAIELLVRKVDNERKTDVFDQTCGVWKRHESADDTVSHIRTIFNTSMHRYEK